MSSLNPEYEFYKRKLDKDLDRLFDEEKLSVEYIQSKKRQDLYANREPFSRIRAD